MGKAQNIKHESLPATTTAEQQVVTAGQRTINLIWENTQSQIAKWVVLTNLLVNSILALVIVFVRLEISTNQLAAISICLQPISFVTGTIIGFYYGRTNHSAIGGVGAKPAPSDKGTR